MIDELRAEARDWFAVNWDPDRRLGDWWALLAQSGWGFPTWPAAWFGKGLSGPLATVVDDERKRAGAAAPPLTLGTRIIAPLLLEFGTQDQKERYLLPTVSGQAAWCELFSEPGAGSDLASLATRAVSDGDEWIVNGQKVWSSGASVSRWGLLAARTDPEATKQRGLTCFVLDMEHNGVDVRPLRTMTGEHKFSEVFVTDATIPNENVIGTVGRGWDVVKATLALERKLIGPAGGGGGLSDNTKVPDLDQPASVVVSSERAGQQRGAMITGVGGSALVHALLEQFGGRDDPIIRQEIARLHTVIEVVRYTALRSRAVADRDGHPGPEASTLKLLSGRIVLVLRDLATRLEGAHTTLSGSDAPMGAIVQKLVLSSPSMAIMTGTDEIQKNIIGERILGLPSEPSMD